MTPNEVLARLLALTACVSIAALAVLVLRRPMRRQFGAGAAYAAWLLLPAAGAAALFPSAPAPLEVQALAIPLAGVSRAVIAPAASAPASLALFVLALWLAGAALAAAVQLLRYRSFVRHLGALSAADGFSIAATGQEGPLLLGVWRPLVVLPSDFAVRYTPAERELILAHERTHAGRRDPLANAAFAAAQCLWWFHPLLHVAARCFRMDQELACDQSVMRAHPGRSRAYAEAMLKTQLSDARAPFACQWQSNHPLKERILNLNRTHQSPIRRAAGRAVLALLLAGGAWSAWAAQADAAPEGAPTYDVAMVVSVDGETSTPHVRNRAGQEGVIRVRSGQESAVRLGREGHEWAVKMVLVPAGTGKVFLRSKLLLDGAIVSEPSLQLALDEKGAIKVDHAGVSFSLEMTVHEYTGDAGQGSAR